MAPMVSTLHYSEINGALQFYSTLIRIFPFIASVAIHGFTVGYAENIAQAGFK